MSTKLLGFIFLFFSVFIFSQTSQELDKVMLSKDYKEIQVFINKYPNNKNIPFLQKKLDGMKAPASSSKPSSETATTNKTVKQESKTATDSRKNTTDVLNHIFNNDPNKKEAYVALKNKTDCNITMKIEGKKIYTLEIPKQGKNFIMLPKGSYNFSASICDAKYLSKKNITEDQEVILNVGTKKVRK